MERIPLPVSRTRSGRSPLSASTLIAFVLSLVLSTTSAQDASALQDSSPTGEARATTADSPLSERRVSYVMDVSLDPQTRTVEGTERLIWRNPAAHAVDELQFHLYLNAFSGPNSTFMKESGGSHRGYRADEESPWGGTDIERLLRVIPGGGPGDESTVDMTSSIRFIQPDDDNTDDRTVIEVPLERPVAPGDSIVLDIDFTSRLPEIVARTGWKPGASGRPFFMVAQWFPKIGVYEIPGQRYIPEDADTGKWYTHQFHANSEFYADFGTYDVTITVPEDYLVGASGVRLSDHGGTARGGAGSASPEYESSAEPPATEASSKTVRYVAEDVHDFAWTASPDFIEYTDRWEHVNLRLLVQPEHAGQARRHFDAAKVALERFADWVGPYPYTTLTLVDGIGGSNGMEYPTLITCGTVYALPKWARMLELVTIHEFGHQYFYGLLASNEAEEAWLDEGINSYLETRVMGDAYGEGSALDLGPLKVDDLQAQRLTYVKNNPGRGAMQTRSWEYRFGDYSKASYSKPATVLTTLERTLGWDVMKQVLHEYYERWAFHHPTARSFQNVAESVSGLDLDWFFDQYVYGTAVVDYAVDSYRYRQTGEGDSLRYQTTVRVQRIGDGTYPQSLRVTFSDGSTKEKKWDGEAEWIELPFTSEERPVDVFIDPEFTVFMDVNRLNNRRAAGSGGDAEFIRRTQLRSAAIIQKLLFLLGSLP